MTDISKYLQSIKLPVMPEVAQALIRTLNDPDADVITVGAVIAKDPALTATLLRMANSAIFGLSRSVHTLGAAITVVGMAQMRARALSICLAKAFMMPPGIDRLGFWRSSMVCAGYSKWLAAKAGLSEQEAWLTGMMLRLGELAIAQQNSGLIAHIEQQPRTPGERWERQRRLAGFDEGTITAEIARCWDFPDAVVEALKASAQPLQNKPPSKLGAVIHVAGLLADTTSAGPKELDGLPTLVLDLLGLTPDALKKSMPTAESLSDISSLQG